MPKKAQLQINKKKALIEFVDIKTFDWELVYLGLFAALCFYAVAADDTVIASFAAMPIFSYVALSVIALFLLMLLFILQGIAQAISELSIGTFVFVLIISGFPFLIFLISAYLVLGMYWSLDDATRTNLISPTGAIAFAISLFQIARNPPSRLKLFKGGIMGSFHADALLSACLSGLIVLSIFSFLALHVSTSGNVNLFRFLAALIIGTQIGARIYPAHDGRGIIQGFISMFLVAAVFAVSFLIAAALAPFASSHSSRLLPLFLAITYAAFIAMRIEKYPSWYFGSTGRGTREDGRIENVTTDELLKKARKK
jgi:hypothetical protein